MSTTLVLAQCGAGVAFFGTFTQPHPAGAEVVFISEAAEMAKSGAHTITLSERMQEDLTQGPGRANVAAWVYPND